ncbi:MAG: hypothetical protein M3Q79_02025 [bacterium]|nr:hypothetical protein [bacterium]
MSKLRAAAVGLAVAGAPVGIISGVYVGSIWGDDTNELRNNTTECIKYFETSEGSCEPHTLKILIGNIGINDISISPEGAQINYDLQEIISEAQSMLVENEEVRPGSSTALGFIMGAFVTGLSWVGSNKLWKLSNRQPQEKLFAAKIK